MDTSGNTTAAVQPAPSLYWLRALIGFPLACIGGLVSAFFAAFLVTYIGHRLAGDRPLPSVFGHYSLWFFIGALPLTVGLLLLGNNRPDRRRKRIMRWVLSGFFLILITVGADSEFGPNNWHQVFRREKALVADASTLGTTYVTPHLETEISLGTNLLWCGTMQLAWNEACDLIGGELHFDQDHPMVAPLNERSFTKESLDEASYVAMAGFVRTNIHQVIRDAVQRKFGGVFKPDFVPDPKLTPRPQDLVAYACLLKKLTFPNAFERLDDALTFGGVSVLAFGLKEFKTTYTNLYSQVLILDYRDENDFVIELKTKSEGDRMILAKVKPEKTLAATVALVRERGTRTNAEPAIREDTLLVPRINFDLTRRFSEIEGGHLVTTNVNVARDLYLLSAVQNTRFEMNEKGVELRSEAHVAIACSRHAIPEPEHCMIFDKPFLILLERKNAKMPYFALWVDNAEILLRSK